MTSGTHSDLAVLLHEANGLAQRLLRGDLSAAAPLAAVERELAALAESVGWLEKQGA